MVCAEKLQKIDASVKEQREARKARAVKSEMSNRDKLRMKRAEALKKRLAMKRKDGVRPMPRKMQKAMEARTASVRNMKGLKAGPEPSRDTAINMQLKSMRDSTKKRGRKGRPKQGQDKKQYTGMSH